MSPKDRMEYLENITLEGLVGLLGVIIASIALGWNILNEIRKTPKARVHAMVAKMIIPGSYTQDDKDYLSITIANIGSRPIRINGIGGDAYKWWWHPFKKNQFIITTKKIPIYLKDGEEHIECFPYSKEQFKELLDNKMQSIYAYDSAGRIHRIPRFKFLDFKNHVRRHIKGKIETRKENKENYMDIIKTSLIPIIIFAFTLFFGITTGNYIISSNILISLVVALLLSSSYVISYIKLRDFFTKPDSKFKDFISYEFLRGLYVSILCAFLIICFTNITNQFKKIDPAELQKIHTMEKK